MLKIDFQISKENGLPDPKALHENAAEVNAGARAILMWEQGLIKGTEYSTYIIEEVLHLRGKPIVCKQCEAINHR